MIPASKCIIFLLWAFLMVSCSQVTQKNDSPDTVYQLSDAEQAAIAAGRANPDLAEQIDSESDDYIETEAEEATDTRLIFPGYTLLFHNYKLYAANPGEELDPNTTVSRDTLYLGEEVFNDLDAKLLQLIPANATDKFKVYLTIQEQIYEIFDEKFNVPTELQRSNYILWTGHQPYRLLPDSAGYFYRLPAIESVDWHANRKAKLNLQDTTIQVFYTGEYSSGEVETVNALKYKGKACGYYLNSALIRIEHYTGKKLTGKKHLVIYFTEGC